MEQTVYIASSKSQQIYVWRLNNEGLLTLVQLVNVPGQVNPMTVSLNKRFLYVGVRPEFRIITYSIAPDNGALNLTKEFPLSGSPTHISTDHKGNYLFVSSYSIGCVSVIKLKEDIPTDTVDIIDGLEGCHSANISPDNKTLWVLALKQDCIYIFNLSNYGKLIAQTLRELKTVKGAGPRHMVFHPNRQYAYVINELDSSVGIWQLDNTHSNIDCIQTIDMMPANFTGIRWASDIHITPNGRHLYTCDRSSNILTIFSVSKNGSKLAIEGFQSTEMQPRSFAIDDYGKFLIIAGQKSHHIAIYKIKGEKGLLEEKGNYLVGQEPVWVAINSAEV